MNEKNSSQKNILIYAHYYVPDVASTGQILRELAEGMFGVFNVTVICTVPSYDGNVSEEYKDKRFYYENINGVNVVRIRVPEFSKTDKKSRVKNILAYFIGAMVATFKTGKFDYVYAISQPPVLGGLLGVFGKWVKRAKYIYNIQDFNPEQIMAVGYSKNSFVLKAMMFLDKFSCKRADKVIMVGRDMVETLKERFKGEKIPPYTYINNWTDEKNVYPLPTDDCNVLNFKKKYGLDNKFLIMYSGNLGLYYDLENIIKVMQKFPAGTKTGDGRQVEFVFVGAGSLKDKLLKFRKAHNMKNVTFIPYQSRSDLAFSLNSADVHWCVNAAGIKGVSVPSKIYGILAAGKPVLGVLEEGTEAGLIIKETGCGLVCSPGDYAQIEKNIKWFIDNASSEELKHMGESGRKYLVENMTKDISIKKYIEQIIEC